MNDDELTGTAAVPAEDFDLADFEQAEPVRGGDAIDLACGHWTEEGPTAVFSNGRRIYTCPAGCGLQERRA